MANNASRQNRAVRVLLILLILLLLCATIYLIALCLRIPGSMPVPPVPESTGSSLFSEPPEQTLAPPETTLPQPEHVVATATIGSMGDLLMHAPIFDDFVKYNAEVQQADGSYDFASVFRFLESYTASLDYAVANLETTLAGQDNGYAYSGYPLFNCPDPVVAGAKDAGFDMLLTANNHSYDTSMVGYLRTLEIIRGQGLETLGTYASAEETKWTVADINGIRIGMLCYTYATDVTEDGRPALNYNAPISEAGLCSFFTYDRLDAFYSEVQTALEEMEAAGAEATVLYIHWGQEYTLSPNESQQQIAQALCDLGIDVIVGGHPHVVQPIALLESTADPEHRTICLYSMGNAVSNQRLGNLSAIQTAHTEDGILFTVTFEKYSDGSVYLSGVDAIPTWVHMHTNGRGKTEYNILPLDYSRSQEWTDLYGLGDTARNAAENSYNRTMSLVGQGLEACQLWLDEQKQDREAMYYALVYPSS